MDCDSELILREVPVSPSAWAVMGEDEERMETPGDILLDPMPKLAVILGVSSQSYNSSMEFLPKILIVV
ncbi:hypothetical protein WISP_139001 [Willisornis vidua]|uniref:Uncharacterized protein n=1 Tax=Willisornis vidua TaxID=1566151 RepID=A0ABQ9CMM0_9PASS|nr:hypothetical protein WISP_139001 [Willisornis vidua]